MSSGRIRGGSCTLQSRGEDVPDVEGPMTKGLPEEGAKWVPWMQKVQGGRHAPRMTQVLWDVSVARVAQLCGKAQLIPRGAGKNRKDRHPWSWQWLSRPSVMSNFPRAANHRESIPGLEG